MRYILIVLSLILFSCGSDRNQTSVGQQKRVDEMLKAPSEEEQFDEATKLLQNMKADEALVIFEKLAKEAKQGERAYCGIGICFLIKREPQKALDAFENAMEIDPNSYDALNGVGSAYLDLKEYEKALEYFRLARNTDPNMVDSNRNLTIVFDKLNKPDSALVYAKKYLETPGSENDFDILQIVKKYSKE